MDHFADAIGDIQVYGQLVRLDLLSVAPGQQVRKGEVPTLQRSGQLVIPLEAFVRAYGTMGRVVQQLLQAGVLKAAPADNTAPPVAAASAVATTSTARTEPGPAAATRSRKPSR